MLANIDIIEILDQAENLGKMITQSEDYEAYENEHALLYKDSEVTDLINRFVSMKEDYSDVQRFGRYHPEYTKIMREIRGVKRDLDMHERVAIFRQKEVALQQLLDDVSEMIAHSVSENIKAPRDGLALKDTGGGCGCGSGGSCGCQAS